MAIVTAATSTDEPTVAFGLNRMTRKAASYMSPSPSGRSGIAPGLCAAPSMPGAGAHAGGGGAAGGGAGRAAPGRYGRRLAGAGAATRGGGRPGPRTRGRSSSQVSSRTAPCSW